MPHEVIRYACDICEELYQTQKSATRCEERGVVPKKDFPLQIGDSLTVETRYDGELIIPITNIVFDGHYVEFTLESYYTPGKDRPVDKVCMDKYQLENYLCVLESSNTIDRDNDDEEAGWEYLLPDERDGD